MIFDGFDFNTFTGFADKAFGFIGKPDPEKYAKGIKELHNSETMSKILQSRIETIEKDPELSRDEKETLKDKVIANYLEDDIKHVYACADVVDRDYKNRGELANSIICGFFVGVALIGAACGVTNCVQNYTGQLHIEPRSNR